MKRKRDEAEGLNPATDAKLQEFLEVMQPSSQAKTWSNGELAVTNQDSVPIIQAEEGESDDEFVEIITKPTKFKDVVTTDALVSMGVGTDTAMEDNSKESTEDVLIAVTKSAEGEQRAMTDEEWLRSRTSRLLDLTDDIEGHLAQLTTAAEKPPIPKITETETTSFMQTETNEDSPAVTQKPHQEDGEEPKAELDAVIEEISKSGRLFLRNLPYTTTEEELWQAFEPFGELEEVLHLPTFIPLYFLSLAQPLRSMMINLIGTSYAMQMMSSFGIDSRII